MRKRMLFVLMMYATFILVACSSSTDKKYESESIKESELEETGLNSEETDIDDREETTVNEITDGIDADNPPINWGTPDGPEIVAENYYAKTVFELVSLEVLQSSTEYVKFSVISKKDGKFVEPNRTIELRYENGVWNVINEGY